MPKPDRIVEELPMGEIADGVAKITEAVEKLHAGKLNERALLLLISQASGQPLKVVRAVLDGMEGLKALYLKP
jgi:hypothetical protein